ncbi:MAG TPA: hypothetical protein H9822_05505 [Candidatus Yaniella excrementavium]|nr:hypothetical protein [Candidatus Yaniella excrementavium]
MARRDSQVFYPSYQSFVPKLLNRPWTAEDGMAPEELNTQVLSSVAAKQLEEFGNTPTVATITPMALQEFYLALGISEMMETNHFFFDPDELEIRDTMVMFVEDADETLVWGIPLDQVSLPDPMVYRRSVGAEAPDNIGEWEASEATVSELIADILTWNYPEEDLA